MFVSFFFCGLYLEVSWSTLGPGVFLYPSRVSTAQVMIGCAATAATAAVR